MGLLMGLLIDQPMGQLGGLFPNGKATLMPVARNASMRELF
jgi:hypothetical protein